jgi:uncharacterized protein (UPF0332 family)
VTPERRALLQYRLARARETLDEARLLLDAGHANACVNRLYYACFYAVSALLLTEGETSAKHRGVRALFDRHWVKSGRVSAELGRVYRRLFARRQRGDYDDLVQFKDEEVRLWLEEARDFVSTLTQIVEEEPRPKEPTSSDGD